MNTLEVILAVVAAGVLGGALNVVGVAGSTISFLVLTAIGLPPAVANSTNLVATPAAFLGAIPGAWHKRRVYRRLWPLFLVAIIGTLGGFWLFWQLPVERFRTIVPILLIIATIALIAQPIIKGRLKERPRAANFRHVRQVELGVSVLLTSVYAGFFGAGVGAFVLLALTLTTMLSWKRANEWKNVICLVTAVIGLGVYAGFTTVHWPIAILLTASMFIGGMLGQRMLNKMPRKEAETVLREIVAVAASFGAGVMLTA